MNVPLDHNRDLYYRLIALWVVCEAFAGGLMHAAKIPFTGMIVSSLAVTCIIFIAYFVPGSTAIIKATVTVAVFKLMLSPHSPPTAYIAVFFQGYLGHLLFNGRKHFALSAVLLAVLALVESALQRILVLLIIYGNTFWDAVDKYVQKIAGGGDKNYSQITALGYIAIHAVGGIIIGILAVRLVRKAERWKTHYPELIISDNEEQSIGYEVKKKKKTLKPLFIILWVLLLIMIIHAYIFPEYAVIPKNDVLRIILRSVLILFSWYLILIPIIKKLIERKLASERVKQKLPLKEILDLLPRIKNVFNQSMHLSAVERGLGRVKLFCKILFVNILSAKESVLQK